MTMRDRMERLLVLPFSVGCVSDSSVQVGTCTPRELKGESHSAATRRQGEESSAVMKKNPGGYWTILKPNISYGIHRLVRRSFKSFSQLFVYKDMEVVEIEMEIGFPTDVKHVTHIGLDGSTITYPPKGWETIKAPEVLSFTSLSLRQFELAMAAQADGPLSVSSSKLA